MCRIATSKTIARTCEAYFTEVTRSKQIEFIIQMRDLDNSLSKKREKEEYEGRLLYKFIGEHCSCHDLCTYHRRQHRVTSTLGNSHTRHQSRWAFYNGRKRRARSQRLSQCVPFVLAFARGHRATKRDARSNTSVKYIEAVLLGVDVEVLLISHGILDSRLNHR